MPGDDVLVGFSEFQSGDFVDAGYAYRAGTDPPNTLRAPITLKQGQGPYVKRRETGRNRWGDYSSSSVDPSDDLSLWTLQEYTRVPGRQGRAVRPLGRVVGESRWRVARRAAHVHRPQAVGRTLRAGAQGRERRPVPRRDGKARQVDREGPG